MTVGPDGDVLSVTVTESRFRPEDVAILLESRRMDEEPRGSHGHLLSEATDPKNRTRFKVPPPVTDFAAAQLNSEQKKYSKAWPDADMDSLLWSVELEE